MPSWLDRLEAPGGCSWKEYLHGQSPQVSDKSLCGRWGECLVAAVVAEHTGGPGNAAGQVIDHMCRSGHEKFERAADQLESAAHKAMKRGTALPNVAPGSDSVAQAQAQPTHVASESSGGSRDSHGSFEERLQKLFDEAPLHAHIGKALHKHAGKALPDEVHEFFSTRGTHVSCATLLKIIGAELCDKAIYGPQPVTAATLVRANELAKRAGIKIATVLGTGKCNLSNAELGALDFIVQEFVVTDTVEDEVEAPPEEFQRIRSEIIQNLDGLALVDMDTEPIIRFDSLMAWLEWLRAQIPVLDTSLCEAFSIFMESIAISPPEPRLATLIHQDDHPANIMCSKSKEGSQWILDAVIDWESAVIADRRLMSSQEPWSTVCCFAHVVKGAVLAFKFVHGRLPRCELGALIHGCEEAAKELAELDWLPYESWDVRVERHRSAGK